MASLNDTIVAVASAPGRSARAVVRVSGPGSDKLLADRFDPAPPTRVAVASVMTLEGKALPVLLARFVGPASYTGEDSAEIQMPGNPHLVERVLRSLLSHPGVRLAEPGEFTARSYLNGKLTLDQAE